MVEVEVEMDDETEVEGSWFYNYALNLGDEDGFIGEVLVREEDYAPNENDYRKFRSIKDKRTFTATVYYVRANDLVLYDEYHNRVGKMKLNLKGE